MAPRTREEATVDGSRDYEVFDLGDVRLQIGATLRGAFLAYKTYGQLNADKSNAIVYPRWYSGRHADNEWLIGEGMTLDPSKYFMIVPNMLGKGLSSSPSNLPPPYDRARSGMRTCARSATVCGPRRTCTRAGGSRRPSDGTRSTRR